MATDSTKRCLLNHTTITAINPARLPTRIRVPARIRSWLLLVLPMTALLLGWSAGCRSSDHSVPISVTDHRRVRAGNYGRIDLTQQQLTKGLTQVFKQMEQRYGPFGYRSIVRDYVPLIRQGLYTSGYCSLQKLHILDKTVDIDIYFRVNQPQPTLYVDVLIDGQIEPAFGLANAYYVAAN